MTTAIDCFAGAGGWAVACRKLGIGDIPVEFDQAALATNLMAATGGDWLFGEPPQDVRSFDARLRVGSEGLIASPPCQTFSTAGNRKGKNALDAVKEALQALVDEKDLDYAHYSDERTGLVLEPMRLIRDCSIEGDPFQWVAFEQVPSALPIWEACADVLRRVGYNAWTGVLNAEQYGVPQCRRRAVLIAHLDRQVKMPTPTHSKFYPRSPAKLDKGFPKWVSMAEALTKNLGGDWEPDFFSQSGTAVDEEWPWKRPSTTVAGRGLVQNPGATANRFNGSQKSRNDGVKITVEEAAILQTFPRNYPWQGSKTQQYQMIGNAIPPLLAEAILREVI